MASRGFEYLTPTVKQQQTALQRERALGLMAAECEEAVFNLDTKIATMKPINLNPRSASASTSTPEPASAPVPEPAPAPATTTTSAGSRPAVPARPPRTPPVVSPPKPPAPTPTSSDSDAEPPSTVAPVPAPAPVSVAPSSVSSPSETVTTPASTPESTPAPTSTPAPAPAPTPVAAVEERPKSIFDATEYLKAVLEDGEIRFADGSVYTGGLGKTGRFQGRGKLVLSSGTTITSIWNNGQPSIGAATTFEFKSGEKLEAERIEPTPKEGEGEGSSVLSLSEVSTETATATKMPGEAAPKATETLDAGLKKLKYGGHIRYCSKAGSIWEGELKHDLETHIHGFKRLLESTFSSKSSVSPKKLEGVGSVPPAALASTSTLSRSGYRWRGVHITQNQTRQFRYEGEFLGLLYDGTGTLEVSSPTWKVTKQYKGDWVLGRREGQGEQRSKDGSLYIGGFKNGKPHDEKGFARHTSADGTMVYTGSIHEGRRVRGKLEWITKPSESSAESKRLSTISTKYRTFYQGDFVNDLPDGRGTWVFPNGDRYVGEVKMGKLHGKGSYTFISGDVYEGTFVDDIFHGEGTYLPKLHQAAPAPSPRSEKGAGGVTPVAMTPKGYNLTRPRAESKGLQTSPSTGNARSAARLSVGGNSARVASVPHLNLSSALNPNSSTSLLLDDRPLQVEAYQGNFEMGKVQGAGRVWFTNRNVLSCDGFEDGKLTGKVKIINPQGKLFIRDYGYTNDGDYIAEPAPLNPPPSPVSADHEAPKSARLIPAGANAASTLNTMVSPGRARAGSFSGPGAKPSFHPLSPSAMTGSMDVLPTMPNSARPSSARDIPVLKPLPTAGPRGLSGGVVKSPRGDGYLTLRKERDPNR